VKILGGALALLLASGPSSWAGLPDAGWPPSFTASKPAAPVFSGADFAPAAAPSVPAVVFKGLSIKSVQFSRNDRIPVSLIGAIDRTEKTLFLAIYDLKLSEVADAILRAKARGVLISLIYDEGHTKPAVPGAGSGPSEEYLALVAAGIPTRLLKGGGSFGIMHHKYAVFDGELLMTGSFNWTRPADEKHFENAVFKTDPALIAGFMKNWKWMWALGRAPASVADSSDASAAAGFGPPPADPVKPVSFAGGKYPRYAFSPQGGVEDMLVDAIGRSKHTIDVAMFSFYAQRVADALIAAKTRGVVVRVVGDGMQARRSQPMLALSKGVDLRLSAGRGGVGAMHHKYALFDGALLMSGSYNFSANAEQFNFENDLFTVDPAEAAAFAGEFSAVWAQARAPEAGDLPPPKLL